VREVYELTTTMCRMSWNSVSLNLLEPSGPNWTYYGTPLPFTVLRNFEMSEVCSTQNEITILSGKRQDNDNRFEVAHENPTNGNCETKPETFMTN